MYNMATSCFSAVCFALFLSIFCLVGGEWNTNDYLKREHSLIRPYTGAGNNIPQWDFIGSTMVTSNYIRLTPDHQSRVGAIWNSVPCRVRNWELHVQFKVHGAGKSLFGDGFAIWYTRGRLQTGSVFGNMDQFVGLAVLADTYSNHNGPHNHQHPYISAMVNNGSLKYDHDRDGTHTMIKGAGCEAQFRNKDYDTYIAIRYQGFRLTVSMDIDGKNGWKECFSVDGVKLPKGYFFGASAATGQLADIHDIISMKLYELDVAETSDHEEYRGLPEADNQEAPRDRVDDSKQGFLSGGYSFWKIFLIVILLLLGLGVVALVGYVIFNLNDPGRKKRFY